MPAKFNKKLWVRRGGFLLIEESQAAADDRNSRVTGTIVAVYYDDQIKQLKKMPGVWPPEFDTSMSTAGGDGNGGSGDARADFSVGDMYAGLPEYGDTDESGSEGEGEQAGCSKPAAATGGSGARGGATGADGSSIDGSSDSDDDGLPPLQANRNRRVIYHNISDSDDSAESGSEEG